jgi:diguanylate cyclase (GGDEF)-like protein
MVPPVLPRILVADDEPANALIIARALRDEFDVVHVANGADVIDRVQAGDIDLVLLDVMMPGLDGFEVCRRLKDNRSTALVPVIFVTALEDSVEEAHGFDVGAIDYITKPIRPSIVRARVHTHISLKRTRDQLEQLASVDSLTGIGNRRRFDAAMAEEWRRSRRRSRWLSIALLDVDHFKQFNDRHGHLAGDERLRAIATALAGCTRRAGELAARYGGEEFGLIFPEVDPEMMQRVVRGLLNGVTAATQSASLQDETEPMTVSIGAVSLIASPEAAETAALAGADSLLYEAKAAGRDCAVHQDMGSAAKVILSRVERTAAPT